MSPQQAFGTSLVAHGADDSTEGMAETATKRRPFIGRQKERFPGTNRKLVGIQSESVQIIASGRLHRIDRRRSSIFYFR